jgi:hypothetical protein
MWLPGCIPDEPYVHDESKSLGTSNYCNFSMYVLHVVVIYNNKTESLNETTFCWVTTYLFLLVHEFAKIYTMGTYCAPLFVCKSKFCTGGSQPKRNVASPVLEFGSQLYIRFLFTE